MADIIKGALTALAVFVVALILLVLSGWGVYLLSTPVGWGLAGLPALVAGGIVVQGSRGSRKP